MLARCEGRKFLGVYIRSFFDCLPLYTHGEVLIESLHWLAFFLRVNNSSSVCSALRVTGLKRTGTGSVLCGGGEGTVQDGT